jgi:hypothetical protein
MSGFREVTVSNYHLQAHLVIDAPAEGEVSFLLPNILVWSCFYGRFAEFFACNGL